MATPQLAWTALPFSCRYQNEAVEVSFEIAVLSVLRGLQPGEVVTYGEVAEQAGYPGAARAVGTLLRRTAVEVPWWRVVGAGGQLRSPDPHRQAELLRSEDVPVRGLRVTRPIG